MFFIFFSLLVNDKPFWSNYFVVDQNFGMNVYNENINNVKNLNNESTIGRNRGRFFLNEVTNS